MSSRPAAGGGRWIDVPPARLARWVENFTARHGVPVVTDAGQGLLLAAPDGASAQLCPPPGAPAPGALPDFLTAALTPRRLGLLLVRRGGVAVGVADGDELVASKVDSRYVQGRTAAGGWSQQRFARRRENQTRALLGEAADHTARLLLPYAPTLTALVCGGDRRAVDTVLADPRLAPLTRLRSDRLLEVAEPRHAVLADAVAAARAVRVLVREPGTVAESASRP